MENERNIYKGETIPLSYTITDSQENEFNPTSVDVYVYDEDSTLLSTRSASVSANTITMLTSGFDEVGSYKLVWEINQTPYKFKHISLLRVDEY